MADKDNIVVLTDEEGNDIEFEFLDIIEYRGEEYIVLFPPEKDVGEVVILRLEKDDSEEESIMSGVEDESVLAAVYEIFREKFKDKFNFV